MTAKFTRYRFAVLLLWAALALVVNPVWHAIGHDHAEHSSEQPSDVADTHWSAQDLCPYCDAVSQAADVPDTTSPEPQLVRIGDIIYHHNRDTDLSTYLSTRLRAPPVLV